MKKKSLKEDEDELVLIPKLNRIYPEKLCANNISCISGGKFHPRDKRQTYCLPKCGENFRNDQRHIKNNREFANEKELRKMDKRIERLFIHFQKGGRALVWLEFFKYEQVDLTMMVFQQHNESTNQPVRWFYQYGVERHPTNQEYFIIYKRKI